MQQGFKLPTKSYWEFVDLITIRPGTTHSLDEYLKVMHGQVRGVPPALDLAAERALQELIVGLAEARLVRSAHDCSDGGIAVTLAECCFDTGGLGAEVSLEGVAVTGRAACNQAATLFGESASRIVVSVAQASVEAVLARAAAAGVPAQVIGRTGGRQLRLKVDGVALVDVPVADAERLWASAIATYFARKVA